MISPKMEAVKALRKYRESADGPMLDAVAVDVVIEAYERAKTMERLENVDPALKAAEIRHQVEQNMGGQFSPEDSVAIEETLEEIIAAAKRGEAIE